jgi:dihydroorotase
MHEGEVSQRLGVVGLSSEAESDIVARDLELVADTGVRYHCQHVSTAQTVELIRQAKQRGLTVTAEVTPHHLWFDENDVARLDTDFKMYPPLRTASDRSALVAAVRDGTIDMVATDHAPHTPEEKSVHFNEAPRGVIGLETAAGAVWPKLAFDRDRFFAAMSIGPARLIGADDHGVPVHRGAPANLVVFDPERSWSPESFRSRAENSPFRGSELKGKVRATIWNGHPVYMEGDAE